MRATHLAKGNSRLFAAIDGQVAAVIAVADPIKASTPAAIAVQPRRIGDIGLRHQRPQGGVAAPFKDKQPHISHRHRQKCAPHIPVQQRAGQPVQLQTILAAIHRSGYIQPNRPCLPTGRLGPAGPQGHLQPQSSDTTPMPHHRSPATSAPTARVRSSRNSFFVIASSKPEKFNAGCTNASGPRMTSA